MKDKLYKIWELLSYVFLIVVLLWWFFSYRFWLAGYDTKCFPSNDPAICSTIKEGKR